MDIKTLAKMINDDIKPNHLSDTEYLENFLKNKSTFTPIPLALGETWERVPKQLLDYLGETETYESGYQISMYGLPSFRRELKKYVFKSEKVSTNFGTKIEVGVTWNGTRSSMVDFGRYMLDKQSNQKGSKPVFITTDPAWDYDGVFLPLGYSSRKILLTPEKNFTPTIDDFRDLLSNIENNNQEYLSFIVINAQHNPTGNNWSKELIEGIIKLSAQYKCGLLIDNAYYGSTSDENNYKSSPLQILEENWNVITSSSTEDLIFGVRSLGKQFHCNGWGIGAIWATPSVLDEIVNAYRTTHSYNYNAIFQKAMEKWLASADSIKYLEDLHQEKSRKDLFLQKAFTEHLNYPTTSLHIGTYSPYVIFEVPRKYQVQQNSVSIFIKELFNETGILVTDCWAIPRNENNEGHLKYARMYTGVSENVLNDALNRMQEKGFIY